MNHCLGRRAVVFGLAVGTFMGARAADSVVIVNAQPLSIEQVQSLEAAYRTRLRPGRYWYDRMTGWWGIEGWPTVGVVAPGLAIGGTLPADASKGTSGVFINGRQLHLLEVAYLQTLGTVIPGRYWTDAFGNIGFEGHPWPFANIYALAQQRYGDRGPHRVGDGAFNSDGRCSYFQSKDESGNHIGASSGCG